MRLFVSLFLVFGLLFLGCTTTAPIKQSAVPNQSNALSGPVKTNQTTTPIIPPPAPIQNKTSSTNGTNTSIKQIDENESVSVPLANNATQNLSKTNVTVKIANWNLQVFGDSKEKNATLMGLYADVIRQFDIVFVQEIRDQDQTAFPALCSRLSDYNCNASSRAGRSSSKEQVGVIYRKGIKIDTWRDFNPDALNRWERPPLSVGFDIRGYRITTYNTHVDPDAVSSELDALEQVVSDGGNVIVLGDLNADCSYYNPQQAHDFDSWKWVISDSDDTTVSSTNCAYDRIILNTDAYGEFVSSGIHQQGIQAALSDHYLVWVEIKTNETTPDVD